MIEKIPLYGICVHNLCPLNRTHPDLNFARDFGCLPAEPEKRYVTPNVDTQTYWQPMENPG